MGAVSIFPPDRISFTYSSVILFLLGSRKGDVALFLDSGSARNSLCVPEANRGNRQLKMSASRNAEMTCVPFYPSSANNSARLWRTNSRPQMKKRQGRPSSIPIRLSRKLNSGKSSLTPLAIETKGSASPFGKVNDVNCPRKSIQGS